MALDISSIKNTRSSFEMLDALRLSLDQVLVVLNGLETEVLGAFTKRYIQKMPYMVEDRWMLSVFVHLLLDSISLWQDVEGGGEGVSVTVINFRWEPRREINSSYVDTYLRQ